MASSGTSKTVVILAHGAGSHMEHRTLEWLSSLVAEHQPTVVRFNFLYRAAGRSMPDRMPQLMEAYRAVVSSVRDRFRPLSLIVGGHSMGGRVASMMEAEVQSADGLLLLGYPLHPAQQPEQLRDSHLPSIKTPTLQINGTLDTLCNRDIMDRVACRLHATLWRVHWVEGADHSYAVKKSTGLTRSDVESEIRSALRLWLPAVEGDRT